MDALYLKWIDGSKDLSYRYRSYTNSGIPVPEKNAWIFIDTTTIGTAALSKFAPNWDVNLSLSCRVVGDQLPEFENANLTSLPMTIQPLGNAENTEIQFQVMLTKGQAVKGNAQEGLTGSYFQRRVKLVVK